SEENELPIISNLSDVLRSFKSWPRIFRILWKTNSLYLSIILFLNILKGLLPAISLVATERLINSVVLGQELGSYKMIIWAFVFLVSVTLCDNLFNVLHQYFDKLFETLLSNQINILIIEKSVSLSLSDFENAEIQDQLKRAQEEANYRPYVVFKEILAV